MHKWIAALVISQLAGSSPREPYHEPQLASAAGLTAVAFGSGEDIYVAVSVDSGQSFAKPVKVGSAPVVPLTRHRGPRAAISQGALVVTAVVGRTLAGGVHAHGLPEDGDLLEWRSIDRGATWSKPVRINDVAAAPREGLHTLTADGHGNLFAAWLDKRGEGTALYGAWSSDSGRTWSKNVKIYSSPGGTICECCHPTAVFNGAAGVDVMWRNVVDGSRDFYLIRSDAQQRWSVPQKLGNGTWKINACPMDGGGLAHDGAKTITAWRRQEQIYLDEPGAPEREIGEGKDVSVAASGGKVYAAWIGKGEQLVVWSSGKTETVPGTAAYPNLTALAGGGVLLAWEANNGVSFRRLQ